MEQRWLKEEEQKIQSHTRSYPNKTKREKCENQDLRKNHFAPAFDKPKARFSFFLS